MDVIGLDIGGANLKGASSTGEAFSDAFEIWRAPEQLASRLGRLISRFSRADRIALTMTAELADCFETKQSGVSAILEASVQAAAGLPVRVWTTQGTFASPEQARSDPSATAAANWHALATWGGRLAPTGPALLFDIGSTTADLIPLRDGLPCPAGRTDVDRLLSGELVYTGVRRTPVFAVAPTVPLRGRQCPLAAEWFATMLDVYLLLGWIAEDSQDTRTANGRPATLSGAHDRLARAVCCDRTEVSIAEAQAIAEALAVSQIDQLCVALDQVLAHCAGQIGVAIVSGEGAFLAQRVLRRHAATRGCTMIALGDRLTPAVAEAACAYAVAVLATERD